MLNENEVRPKSGGGKGKCVCPFCETELQSNCLEPVFCQPCDIKFVKCKSCQTLFNSKMKKCPSCGEKYVKVAAATKI